MHSTDDKLESVISRREFIVNGVGWLNNPGNERFQNILDEQQREECAIRYQRFPAAESGCRFGKDPDLS